MRRVRIECSLCNLRREDVASVMGDRSLGLIDHCERIRSGLMSHEGRMGFAIHPFPNWGGCQRRRGWNVCTAFAALTSLEKFTTAAGKIAGDSPR